MEFLTVQEFLARPERDDGQKEELIEGELIVSPGAKVSHAAIVGRLRASLASLEQGGYVLANDFACILGNSMSIPDLAAVQRDRWDSAALREEWLMGSPEFGHRGSIAEQSKTPPEARRVFRVWSGTSLDRLSRRPDGDCYYPRWNRRSAHGRGIGVPWCSGASRVRFPVLKKL